MHQQKVRGQRRPGETLGIDDVQADQLGPQDNGDRDSQGDQMGRIDPQQPPDQELCGGDASRHHPPAVDARQDEAREQQEEVGRQIPAPEELIDADQGHRGFLAEVEDHDEGGREEAQDVEHPAPGQICGRLVSHHHGIVRPRPFGLRRPS